MDPPYYPNKSIEYKKFSEKFKSIFSNPKKTFKTIWLTDETYPSPKYCDLLINDFPEANKFKDFYKKHYKKIKLITGIYAFFISKRNFEKKIQKKPQETYFNRFWRRS